LERRNNFNIVLSGGASYAWRPLPGFIEERGHNPVTT